MSNKAQSQVSERQKKFANFWGPLMPNVRTLKNLAHLCSAITQAVAIFKIIQSQFEIAEQVGLIVISLAFAILVSVVIEKGLSTFFPFLCRQFVWKQFKSWEDWAMMVLLILIVLPLGYFSPSLSSTAGFDLVDRVITPIDRPDTDSIDQKYAVQTATLSNRFTEETTAINLQFSNQIKSVKSKYQAQIDQQQSVYKRYKKLKQQGYNWAASHMGKAKTKILAIKADRDAEIAKIEADKSTTLSRHTTLKQTALAEIAAEKKLEKTGMENDFQESKDKRNSNVGIWGGLAYYLMLFCAAGVMVLILIIEIYKKGSGVEYVGKRDKKAPSILGDAWSKLAKRIKSAYWNRFGSPEQVAYLKAAGNPDIIFEEIPIDPKIIKRMEHASKGFDSIESLDLKLLTEQDKTTIELTVNSFDNIKKLKEYCRQSYKRRLPKYTKSEKKQQKHIYKFLRSKDRLHIFGFYVAPKGDKGSEGLEISKSIISLQKKAKV